MITNRTSWRPHGCLLIFIVCAAAASSACTYYPMPPPRINAKYLDNRLSGKTGGNLSASSGVLVTRFEDADYVTIYPPDASLTLFTNKNYSLSLSTRSYFMLGLEGMLRLHPSDEMTVGFLHGAGAGSYLQFDKSRNNAASGALFWDAGGGLFLGYSLTNSDAIISAGRYTFSYATPIGVYAEGQHNITFAHQFDLQFGYSRTFDKLTVSPQFGVGYQKLHTDPQNLDNDETPMNSSISDVWVLSFALSFVAPI